MGDEDSFEDHFEDSDRNYNEEEDDEDEDYYYNGEGTCDEDESNDEEGDGTCIGYERTYGNKRRSLNEDKVTLLPVLSLSSFLCCSMLCLGCVSVADLALARDHYQEKNKQERSQFIMDYLVLNKSSTGDYVYHLGTENVCLAAWRTTLGIPESSFYNIKKQVIEGKRNINKSGHLPAKKTQMAFVSLKDLSHTFAGAMPHNAQLHLPCCLTKSAVYEMYAAEMNDIGEDAVSYYQFLRMWRTNLQYIAILKRSRFSECNTCALLKKELGETKDKIIRQGLMEQRNKHLHQQKAERNKYYKHVLKAKKEPSKYLSIIMDAMDQSKTMLPHFVKSCKSIDAMWKLKTHLLAVRVHGVGDFGYFDNFQFPHGSNLTITTLLNVICMMDDNLPETLYLQMDNCGRENKNRFVLAFLCLLVEFKIFKKIKLSFLMVGHTNEDIDQLFSIFSTWLNRNDAITMEDLIKGFENCSTPAPTGIVQTHVHNFSSWVEQYINPMIGHSKPHVFRITNQDGHAKIQCKKWSTSKEWMDCSGTENYLLKEVPVDVPPCLLPTYKDLDRTVDTLNCAKSFMKPSQYQWWTHFLEEKEDEASNFDQGVVFPLNDLAEQVSERRRQKEHVPVNNVPVIVHDDDIMEPVTIGKPIITQKNNVVEVKTGSMVLLAMDKYMDEWPQVAKVMATNNQVATILWYGGSMSGPWKPCSIPVSGQRGKEQPFTEEVPRSSIWLHFELTNKNCLPKNVKMEINNFVD